MVLLSTASEAAAAVQMTPTNAAPAARWARNGRPGAGCGNTTGLLSARSQPETNRIIIQYVLEKNKKKTGKAHGLFLDGNGGQCLSNAPSFSLRWEVSGATGSPAGSPAGSPGGRNGMLAMARAVQ